MPKSVLVSLAVMALPIHLLAALKEAMFDGVFSWWMELLEAWHLED